MFLLFLYVSFRPVIAAVSSSPLPTTKFIYTSRVAFFFMMPSVRNKYELQRRAYHRDSSSSASAGTAVCRCNSSCIFAKKKEKQRDICCSKSTRQHGGRQVSKDSNSSMTDGRADRLTRDTAGKKRARGQTSPSNQESSPFFSFYSPVAQSRKPLEIIDMLCRFNMILVLVHTSISYHTTPVRSCVDMARGRPGPYV